MQRSSSGRASLIGAPGRLRQAGDAEELVRKKLRLAVNDVVTFLGEPVHEFGRLFAVHQLKRPRRDQLNVGAVSLQRVEVSLRADFGVVERDADFVVGDFYAAAPMRSARREQHGLVGPELRRRADVSVTIDNHLSSSPVRRLSMRLVVSAI